MKVSETFNLQNGINSKEVTRERNQTDNRFLWDSMMNDANRSPVFVRMYFESLFGLSDKVSLTKNESTQLAKHAPAGPARSLEVFVARSLA